jgi:hypothetical protein
MKNAVDHTVLSAEIETIVSITLIAFQRVVIFGDCLNLD